MTVEIIGDGAALANLAARIAGAPVVAVDVEANGLFAFRARLCTVQLATATELAVVDALAVGPTPLAHILGPAGPRKILHDLTFDARMLADAGVALGNVFDTSVAARMLGRKETGLASLLASELGIVMKKDLQQHDWARRPFTAEQVGYLAADVLHLVELESRLIADAERLGITQEIAEECRYKLATAFAPPRDERPAYLRVRGLDKLDPAGRAIVYRLVEARDELAEAADVPPFKAIGNEALFAIAERRPVTIADIASIRGVPRRARSAFLQRLLAAVAQGVVDGAPPTDPRETPARVDRTERAERRIRETRLTGWRRAEAKQRGVDEQVVLPGHCVQDLSALDGLDPDAIAQVAGFGQVRIARYGSTIASLLRGESLAVPQAVSSSPPPP